MSLDTVSILFRRLVEERLLSDRLTCSWHAGEPLVVGVPFFSQMLSAISAVVEGSVAIKHNIQTNGTLITNEWCDLFLEHEFAVGVSLDGPAWLNDRHRRDWAGRATTDRVFAGMELLAARGVPFHIISVLTKDALASPEDVFRSLASTGASHLCFSVEEVEGVHRESSLSSSAVDRAYMSFMSTVLELAEDAGVSVREERLMGDLLLGRQRPGGLTAPLGVLTVSARGDFCTFSPELLSMTLPSGQSAVMGNVLDGPLRELVNSSAFCDALTDIEAGVSMCRQECEYFAICGGGAPSNKLAENGTFRSTETTYCRLTKMRLAEVVLSRLEARMLPEL